MLFLLIAWFNCCIKCRHRIISVDSVDVFAFCINAIVEIDGGERPAPYRSVVIQCASALTDCIVLDGFCLSTCYLSVDISLSHSLGCTIISSSSIFYGWLGLINESILRVIQLDDNLEPNMKTFGFILLHTDIGLCSAISLKSCP